MKPETNRSPQHRHGVISYGGNNPVLEAMNPYNPGIWANNVRGNLANAGRQCLFIR